MTHNYDFYRTICQKLSVKDSIEIVLKKINIKGKFNTWKKEYRKIEYLISSIPFVRNLPEYLYGEKDPIFLKLTSLLHIKIDTSKLTNLSDIVIDKIYDTANIILADTSDFMELENKIALSIAIRLKAEEFMISKINNPNFIAGITRNQTIVLVKNILNLSK